jgi:FixJ family two-component response regulator
MEVDRRTLVLILARCLDIGCYLEAMEPGAVGYLQKPVPASFPVRLVGTYLRPRKPAA